MNIMPPLLVALLACLCGAAIGKACPEGQHMKAGKCVSNCPPNKVWSYGECAFCVGKSVAIDGECKPCPEGQIKVQQKCACPEGQHMKAGKCVSNCPPNKIWSYGECAFCPHDLVAIEGECKPCPIGEVKIRQTCQCPGGQERVDGVCQPECQQGQVKKDGICTDCPDGRIAFHGTCTCPEDERDVRGKCECQRGQVRENGNCTHCPDGQIAFQGTCTEREECKEPCKDEAVRCHLNEDKKESCVKSTNTKCRCRSRCQYLKRSADTKSVHAAEIAAMEKKPKEYDCNVDEEE